MINNDRKANLHVMSERITYIYKINTWMPQYDILVSDVHVVLFTLQRQVDSMVNVKP